VGTDTNAQVPPKSPRSFIPNQGDIHEDCQHDRPPAVRSDICVSSAPTCCSIFFTAQCPPGSPGNFSARCLPRTLFKWSQFFQVVPGILLLINRYVPLALALLGPVIFNICLVHILMAPSGLPMAAFVVIFVDSDGVSSSLCVFTPVAATCFRVVRVYRHILARRPILERFHNTRALSGSVQGVIFLRKMPLKGSGLRV